MIKTMDAKNLQLLNGEIARARELFIKASTLLYEHEYFSKINGVSDNDVETVELLNESLSDMLYRFFKRDVEGVEK